MNNKIDLFGQEYDIENIPDEIILGCGCIYKKDIVKIGISFSIVYDDMCETHKGDLAIMQQQVEVSNEIESIELKIHNKIRELAIIELKNLSEIPQDYI